MTEDDKALVNPLVERIVESAGYKHGKCIGENKYACILPLMFTAAIITGKISEIMIQYDDRWCYHSIDDAKAALDAWDGIGEPDGWHRHPMTGRRRENNREYINF